MPSLVLSPEYILTFLSKEELELFIQQSGEVLINVQKLDDADKELFLKESKITLRKYKLSVLQVMQMGELHIVTREIKQFLCGGKTTIVNSPDGKLYTSFGKPTIWWWDYLRNRPTCSSWAKSWESVLKKYNTQKYGIIWKRNY